MLALALDSGFGTLGKVTFSFSQGDSSTVEASAIAPDGSVFVAGTDAAGSALFRGYGSIITVAKLTPAGTLDTTFGTGGVAFLMASGEDETAAGLAVDGKGNVDVLGTTAPGKFSATGPASMVVGRFLPSGQPDPSFGADGDGLAKIAFPAGSAQAGSIALQGDGKIVVAGDVLTSGTSADEQSAFAAARLNADGTPDTTFGSGGLVTVPVSLNVGYPDETDEIVSADLAIRPDGKIVLGGTYDAGSVASIYVSPSTTALAITQLDPDGSLDPAFGTGGTVFSNQVSSSGVIGSFADIRFTGLALQPDGNLLVAGSFQSIGFNTGSLVQHPVAIRLEGDGSTDPTYNASALSNLVLTTGGPIALQPDGRAVLLLPAVASTETSGFLRLNSDGSIDDGSGLGGVTSTGTIATASVGIEPDGSIVVAGSITPSEAGASSAVVARYNAQTAPGDYFGIGRTQLSVDDRDVGIFQVETPSGSITRPTSFGPPSPLYGPVSADFDGDGKADLAVYDSSAGILGYRPSAGGPDVVRQVGMSGGVAVPVSAAYGTTGVAIYYPQFGVFANLNQPYQSTAVAFGSAGDSVPSVGDFDGSGSTELGYYVPKTSTFFYRSDAGASTVTTQFGPAGSGFLPAIGDYDGDGKSDLALYSSQYSVFLEKPSSGGAPVAVQFGPPEAGFVAVPGDYDGDGKTDLAIYNPQYGLFIYRPSSGGKDVAIPFGPTGGAGVAVLTAGVGASSISTSNVHAESVGAGSLAAPVVIGSLDLADAPGTPSKKSTALGSR